MRLAVTGATGLVGRFLVEEALGAGDDVLSLSRTSPRPGIFSGPVAHLPFDLAAPPPDLAGYDALLHLAFLHAPGRYRGGEGDDPEGFRRANLGGSLRLFRAAREAGVGRVLFLSSRAVYGAFPDGTRLSEDMEPRPDTLYGEVKLAAEQGLAALAAPGFACASLRATGVYGPAGPGQKHKWHQLFADYLAGQEITPRVATEVHGVDLAAGVRILLSAPADALAGRAFNLSDLVLDRHDLLAEVARLTGSRHRPPRRADASAANVMECARLAAFGWAPGGMERLRASLPDLLKPMLA